MLINSQHKLWLFKSMVGCAGKTCFWTQLHSENHGFPIHTFLLYVYAKGQGVSLYILYGTSQQQGNMHISRACVSQTSCS